MDMEPLPQYIRIAMDLASRIAAGEFNEHERISGRSVLASEYNVSPETVRKAVRLLADMKVVEVQEKKGIVILSADNARRYIQSASHLQERQHLRQELRELIEEYRALGKRVFSVAEQLINSQANPLPQDKTLPNYEIKLEPDSEKIGQTIGQLHFWQATGATIVAIKRNKNTILSPGPYAELYDGDSVVFVGPEESVAAVRHFLNGEDELFQSESEKQEDLDKTH